MSASGRRTADDKRSGEYSQASFAKVKRAEVFYARQLRAVARQIGQLTRAFTPGEPGAMEELQRILRGYAAILTPWARNQAARMLADVARRDYGVWVRLSRTMSRALGQEIKAAPTGVMMQSLLAEQVELISSLPLQAAQRVHELTVQGLTDATRASEISKAILATGEVSKSRADLIARTEVARTASVLVQARAQYVGSTGYIWRTARDVRVRKEHRLLEGQFVRWDSPPIAAADGTRAHAGQIYNCFPGSTKVSLTNGCHYLWRRWYEGHLIQVEFEGGRFEATPNHPILTGRGWVALQDLQTGDYLIQSTQDSILALAEDENEGQPSFDDLFATLDGIFHRKSVKGFLFNLHGEGTDDDIDEIWSDQFLPGHGKPNGFQPDGNRSLSWADRRVIGSVGRSSLKIGGADCARGFDEFPTLVGAHTLEPTNVSLRARTSGDAMTLENFRDGQAIAAEFESNGQFTHSCLVSCDHSSFGKVRASVMRRSSASLYFDSSSPKALAHNLRIDADLSGGFDKHCSRLYKPLRLINKSIRSFAGHVFTIQSINGWFSITSSGIIVKNCRCYPEPQLADEI